MNEARSVVVCGGGVVGLFSAYYLAKSGHRVTVVERGSADHDSCVLGSAGYVSPSHVVPLASPGVIRLALRWMFEPKGPFYMRPRIDPEFLRWAWLFRGSANEENVRRGAPVLRDLGLASGQLHRELAEETGNAPELVREGILMLCKTPRMLEHERHAADLSRELGLEAEEMDPGRMAQLEPGLRLDAVGGVFYPGDAHLTPPRLMEALTRRLRELGVVFRWNTTVRGWRARNGYVHAALTSSGEVDGDVFVLAGGSWSPGVVRDLGIRLPVQAGKGYSLTLPAPRRKPRISLICMEARVAVTPMGSALRFAGTMEFSGLDMNIRPERVQGILESVPRYLPDFVPGDFEGVRPWCGLRPCSPDGLPFVGPFRRYPNLIAATGHAMLGLTLAPGTGKLVDDLVSRRAPFMPLEPLSPDRFQEERKRS